MSEPGEVPADEDDVPGGDGDEPPGPGPTSTPGSGERRRHWWQRRRARRRPRPGRRGCLDDVPDGCTSGYGRGYGSGWWPGGGCLPDLDDGCLPDLDGCGDGCDAGGCDLMLLTLLASTVLAATRTPAPAGTRAGSRLLTRLVVGYRTRVSPARPPCCRFTPTCSTYALQALQAHGPLRGIRLTAARLRRCRPGGGAGADPVPGPA